MLLLNKLKYILAWSSTNENIHILMFLAKNTFSECILWFVWSVEKLMIELQNLSRLFSIHFYFASEYVSWFLRKNNSFILDSIKKMSDSHISFPIKFFLPRNWARIKDCETLSLTSRLDTILLNGKFKKCWHNLYTSLKIWKGLAIW